jgi:hypothetical protein
MTIKSERVWDVLVDLGIRAILVGIVWLVTRAR